MRRMNEVVPTEQVDPWQRLREFAARRDEQGRRPLLPLLGSGFNAQAGKGKSWQGLLEDISKAHGLELQVPTAEELVGNTTLVWEAMLLEMAVRTGKQPAVVERELQRTAAEVLKDAYRVGGVTAEFAKRFLGYRFIDIISFNFDYGLHVDESAWNPTRRSEFEPITSCATVSCGTRVWYPHGSVRNAESIQLGLRKYGVLIRELEEARGKFKRAEDHVKQSVLGSAARNGVPSLEQREQVWSVQRRMAESWVSAAMNAPLLFVGLSMGREEWPLWWFLNQRARNHARWGLDDRLPTFVFIPSWEAKPLRPAARLARITLLEYDDYKMGWERLFETLGEP